MTTSSNEHALHGLRPRPLSAACAFLLSLCAGQAAAIDIPAVPLQSGAAYPEPNVWFILDDSGSMGWVAMPASISSDSNLDDDIFDKSYVHNTIYYNPNVTYQPWMQADGTRMTGGTSYTAACSSSDSAGPACTTVDLSNSTRTFFVPRAGITDINDATQYDRYDIKSVSGTVRVVKQAASSNESWSFNLSGNQWNYQTITVPSGATSLTVRLSGGSNNRDADLYLRLGSNPDGSTYDCRSNGNSNNETCTVNNPAAGTWHIGVYNYSNRSNNNLDLVASVDAVTYGTPTGRTEAQELANYATWYSYHRTRMKTAKAGASEAFSQVGSNLRIGFDTINRNTDNLPYRIPVGTNNGLFSGSNKSDWYSHLLGAQEDNGTPLRRALSRAGNYLKETGATGPWGPESGSDQITCRQNFAILTTDGFWNGDLSSTYEVGNSDNENGPTHTSTTGATYAYARARPFRDGHSNTLADIAMDYWKRDLRTDLVNNVPTSADNPAFWQNMTTFSVSIGLQGTLNPKTDLSQLTLGTKSWPDPTDAEDAERIDDLWHASVNGHGTFVQANNTREFSQGLLDAFSVVAQRQGSASNVTANSTSFNTDTQVFQASYVSGKWTGELAAYGATSSGASSTPAWRASQGIPTSGRRVFTWNSATSAGATFPTSAQETALDKSSRSRAPISGANNAAYLKGDRSRERQNGGELRNRDHLLGDIVNSSPMYSRDVGALFVGANDGMLHAVNASTGAELFTYVPAGLNFSALGELSDPYYSHSYSVDGPVVVSSRSQTPGKNYLVGSLGRGGKGLYALDVTTPSTFAAGNVMWELSSGANLGMVLGEPLVATLNGSGARKVTIFGNGINSSNGNAVLYVVDIVSGAVLAQVDTGVGSDNGLSAARGWDDDGNGTVDYVYAGDLKGNLWRFDLSALTVTATDTAVTIAAPTKLFQAGTGQAITAGLAIAREPSTGQRWVYAGTGRFLSTADASTTTVQAVFGIKDTGTLVNRSDLQERDVLVTGTVNGKPVRSFPANDPLAAAKKGWALDLGVPTAGERVIDRPVVRGSVLVFSSIIPPTGGTCDAGGSGYVNAIDAFSGSSTAQPYFDADGDGSVDDDDSLTTGSGDEVPVGSIDLGVGMVTLPTVIDNRLFAGGSEGELGSVMVNPQGGNVRRASWREIVGD